MFIPLDQAERAFQMFLNGASIRELMRALKWDHSTARRFAGVCADYDRQKLAAESKNDRYSRLISYQRSFSSLERGRAPGGRETRGGVAAADQAPTPNSMRLYPFLAILTDQPREFVSERLPMSQWTEG